MAGETPITVVGNLTADPELRFTPSGAAVANFTVASTPRTFDRQTNEWKDGEALFLSCSVWRQAAENAAESLPGGMRVVVSGRLKARTYETREGEKRTSSRSTSTRSGPACKYATAKVTKTTRSGGGRAAASPAAATTRGRLAAARAAARAEAAGAASRAAARAVRRRLRPAGQRPLGVRRGQRLLGRASVLICTDGRGRAREHPDRDTSQPSTTTIPAALNRVRAGLHERSTTMAKPVLRKPKKKVCQFCKDKVVVRRLQGHDAAAQVHLRPRQDPRPSRHRQLRAAPA